MTFADHGLPALAVLVLWFGSTALVLWLANRPRATYAAVLVLAAIAGIGGLGLVALNAGDGSRLAAYGSFLGGLLVWGWLEIGFLTGAVTGPRRVPPRGTLRGWRRFAEASATVIHHELSLAAAATLLLAITWGAVNPTGAYAFALLFALRLSAKLNIHIGVPNLSDELLPPHLGYLRGYLRRRRFGPALAASLAALVLLLAWLGARTLAGEGSAGAATGASLLFALGLLGTIEHVFLALPVRDGALWRWALPGQPREI